MYAIRSYYEINPTFKKGPLVLGIGHELLFKNRFLSAIENTQVKLLFFAGPGKGLISITGIMVVGERPGMLSEPLIRINLVKGDTRLENIHQGIAPVFYGRLEDCPSCLRVADIGASDEGGSYNFV